MTRAQWIVYLILCWWLLAIGLAVMVSQALVGNTLLSLLGAIHAVVGFWQLTRPRRTS